MDLKLNELKQLTWRYWTQHCRFQDVVVQPDLFKAEIRKDYGDLRRKSTWVKAAARFIAANTSIAASDSVVLITDDLNFAPDTPEYQIRYEVLDAFLEIPKMFEAIKNGFEEIFSEPGGYTPQEMDGITGLLQWAQQHPGINRQLVGASVG
jgi:hypothetical protein